MLQYLLHCVIVSFIFGGSRAKCGFCVCRAYDSVTVYRMLQMQQHIAAHV